MPVIFKPLNTENIALAIDLATDVFGAADRQSISDAYRKSLGLVSDHGILPNVSGQKYFLAFEDEIPLGVTGYYTITGHTEDAWLGWLAVSDRGRGKGLGRLLTSEAFALAQTDGINNLRIWTTTDKEYDSARALYNKMGFIEEPYRENAQDAARLVLIFSKATKGATPENSWRQNPYLIDCEDYTIPDLNAKLGLG